MRAFLLLVILTALATAQPADTIYYNGKIITMWGAHPSVQAVAIRGDRFLKLIATRIPAEPRSARRMGRCR